MFFLGEARESHLAPTRPLVLQSPMSTSRLAQSLEILTQKLLSNVSQNEAREMFQSKVTRRSAHTRQPKTSWRSACDATAMYATILEDDLSFIGVTKTEATAARERNLGIRFQDAIVCLHSDRFPCIACEEKLYPSGFAILIRAASVSPVF